MHAEDRFGIFVIAVIAVAFGIYYGLPEWSMDIVVDLGISFVISGIFYSMFMNMGLEFLKDIQFKFISAMSIVVFITKSMLI
jgi:hypothetical protein